MESILGTNSKTITLGGRAFEMRPLTAPMLDEVIEIARRKAITAFFKTAKECGMPFDLIRTQLDRINSVSNVDDILTSGDLARILFMRSRHSGVTLEDAQEIPIHELTAAREAILGMETAEEAEKKIE